MIYSIIWFARPSTGRRNREAQRLGSFVKRSASP